MKANTKTGLWVLGAVIVVAIVAAMFMKDPMADDQASNNGDQQNNGQAAQEQPGTDETPTPTPTPTSSGAKLSYTEALKIYGVSGYRFQFSDSCLGVPGKLTIKKNQKFMLDNRDDVAHTFKIKSQTFRLGKYGFAIVTASETGDLDILCDGATRAEILVQP